MKKSEKTKCGHREAYVCKTCTTKKSKKTWHCGMCSATEREKDGFLLV